MGLIFLDSLHYLLMKAHTLLSKRVMYGASEIGLTSGQPKVLEFLSEHGESDQKTIASHCLIEPATVGNILLRMEESGLVSRSQRAGNRRSLYVSLTGEGREAAERMRHIFIKSEEAVSRNLSDEEISTLKALLSKIAPTGESDA